MDETSQRRGRQREMKGAHKRGKDSREETERRIIRYGEGK